MAQVQQHVFGHRGYRIGLGCRIDQRGHLSDVESVQPVGPDQLDHAADATR
jgi:hypothetical protein